MLAKAEVQHVDSATYLRMLSLLVTHHTTPRYELKRTDDACCPAIIGICNLVDFFERVRSGVVGRRTGLDRHPRINFYYLYDAACVSDAPLVYDVDNVPVRARCTRSLAGPPGSK